MIKCDNEVVLEVMVHVARRKFNDNEDDVDCGLEIVRQNLCVVKN